MTYPRLLLLSAAVSLGLVWAWVAAVPLAFMDPEYPAWRAKQVMLDRCDTGEAVILGDSRAAAGILPNLLPFHAVNLAVGGGEAIEAYAALTRALACPVPLKLAILSFDPGHFTRADLFWERSVRFGFMTSEDIAGLREASRKAGDMSVYEARHVDSQPPLLRDWLYQVHFPPLYFASLAHGGVFLRWSGNETRLTAVLQSRGQYYFGLDAGSGGVAVEGHMQAFRPLPILDVYFDKLLTLLDEHGIESRFVAMPVNEATWRQVRPGVRDAFAAWLLGHERRHPRFRVASDIMPHWPDRLFGDRFCHLNPDGAERFSMELAQRLQEAPPSTQNEAQKGWLSDTGRDASAKVLPISKRGS
jgi:hypothetical protein